MGTIGLLDRDGFVTKFEAHAWYRQINEVTL